MLHRVLYSLTTLAVVAAAATVAAQGRSGGAAVAGAVYLMSNAPTGNEILIYDRLADGRLEPGGAVATGGLGTGGGLGNQGGVALSDQGRWLFAVNAASDTVSVFRIRNRGLDLVDVEPSGGMQPVSVTSYRNLLFVLNGVSDSIAGFRVGPGGDLEPIGDSVRALSGSGVGAAQIAFSPRGDVLVVTEKATNRIVTFQVDHDGRPGFAQVHDSVGQTPFGFSFGKRDQLFVSEAFGGAPNASATSSYAVGRDGSLTTISPSVGTNQTANCWVVVTPDGRFAYVTNTGSGSISGYRIGFDGEIELLDADGRTGVTGDGSGPIDLALAPSGRFLYSLNSGTGTIGAFQVGGDGSLAALSFAMGLPAGANGLAVR